MPRYLDSPLDYCQVEVPGHRAQFGPFQNRQLRLPHHPASHCSAQQWPARLPSWHLLLMVGYPFSVSL
jgi:hypothetical protein